MSKFEPEYATLCAVHRDENQELFPEFIGNVQSLTPPDELKNQDVFINNDEYSEYSVTYSDGEPETPSTQTQRQVFFSDVYGEDNEIFHTHIYATIDDIFDLLRFQKQVMAPADEISIPSITVLLRSDMSFESEFIESDVAAVFNSDLDISLQGTEFINDEYSIAVSESDDGGAFASVSTITQTDCDPVNLDSILADHIEEAETIFEGK